MDDGKENGNYYNGKENRNYLRSAPVPKLEEICRPKYIYDAYLELEKHFESWWLWSAAPSHRNHSPQPYTSTLELPKQFRDLRFKALAL